MADSRRRSRKKRSYKRLFLTMGMVAVLVVAALAVYFFGWFRAGSLVGTTQEEKLLHVMILGVDRRSDDVGRSDTLMVASLNESTGQASLISIPRDTRVKIEGHGYDKINHAYAFGGKALSQSSVEELLGVHMDHYILIDVHAFTRIIDAMGGVDLDVEKRMHYEDPWDDNGGLVIDLKPGKQHLDGAKAIQYVRYRDGEGDIGRIGRQQKFMRAVLAQLVSPETLPRIPQVMEAVFSVVETDMSVGDFVAFAKRMKEIQDKGLGMGMVPGRPAYYQDISYWLPDMTALRKMVVEAAGLTFDGDFLAAAKSADEAYIEDLPKNLELVEKHKDDDQVAKKPAEKSVDGKDKKDEKDTVDKKVDSKQMDEKNKKESLKPNEISVKVINSSGINGAGAEVAEVLKRKGFIISAVETGTTSSREKTTITTEGSSTDLFYGMPFPCIIRDGGGKAQAVVEIGGDYAAK